VKTRTAVLFAALLLAAPAASEPADDSLDLDSIGRDLERIRLEEHSLRKVLERSQSEEEALRQRIVLRGRAYYRLSRSGPSGDFLQHAVRIERLRSALLIDLGRLDGLLGQKKRADRTLSVLARRRAPLEVEARAADRARDALLEHSERQRAFELAFESSRGPSAHTAVYSAGSDVGGLEETFAAMRGRLPFPVPGRAEVETVKLPYAHGPGLYMKAYLGAPARSVFPGRVAYADEYPEYGKTVLLDHGDGYFTVTAGLSSIEVRVGDDLPAGARLGLCGTSGGQGRIYFEVRRGAETLHPGEWFGI